MSIEEKVRDDESHFQTSKIEVRILKFLAFLGGFPLSISQEIADVEDPGKVRCKIRRFFANKLAYVLAILLVLLPCLVSLSLLFMISVEWSNFTDIMEAGGFSWWETVSVVST